MDDPHCHLGPCDIPACAATGGHVCGPTTTSVCENVRVTTEGRGRDGPGCPNTRELVPPSPIPQKKSSPPPGKAVPEILDVLSKTAHPIDATTGQLALISEELDPPFTIHSGDLALKASLRKAGIDPM
ncbi:hypothetical protein NN561_014113 [Cricetulus griseus]